MNIEKLKEMLTAARKEQNSEKTSFIGYLIGECTRQKKNPTEAEVIKILENFLNSSKSHPGSNADELALVESWLPKKLSIDEITKIIKETDFSDIGSIMKHFKELYAGKYNGSEVKACADQHLSEKKSK